MSLMDASFRGRLEQLGASVTLVEDAGRTGNQGGLLAELHRLLDSRQDSFWPRQYDNPDNPVAYSRLAEILAEKIDSIDCLVGCVGSGGSLCGTAIYLHGLFPALRVIAVDTNNSVLFGHQAGPRLLRGLGNSIMPKNLDHALIDEVHWVGAFQAFAATRDLHRHHTTFAGPTSGAAHLVADWYARTHEDDSVAVILPDEGYRHQSTVYSDDWLESLEGWPSARKTAPPKLLHIAPASEDAWTHIKWSRRRLQGG